MCAYFADDAFASDKVFERSVRADRGVIGANTLSNDMPLGLFEKITEKHDHKAHRAKTRPSYNRL